MSEYFFKSVLRGMILGFVVIGSFSVSAWVIRPLVRPRHGQWDGGNYFINGKKCGNVNDWTFSGGGFEASVLSAPLWVGLGGVDTYQSESAAKKQVEEWCK